MAEQPKPLYPVPIPIRTSQVPQRLNIIAGCFCPIAKTKTREIGVWPSYLDLVRRHFPPRCLHEFVRLIPGTLREPNSVWRGVREPDPGEDHAGYCYAEPFANKINGEGLEYPNRDGHVFCVYVNADFIIYEFRWDEPDAADNRLPRDCSTRFHERVL